MSTHQYILAQSDRALDEGTVRSRARLRYVDRKSTRLNSSHSS